MFNEIRQILTYIRQIFNEIIQILTEPIKLTLKVLMVNIETPAPKRNLHLLMDGC